MKERSLVTKLAEVMSQVKHIPKNGFNKFHKYHYATEADVNEKVREELFKRNVVLIPNMKSHTVREHKTNANKTEYIVTAEIEFTFMDGDSGETIAFTVFGEGQDAGDKGVYKAITGAQKYALMKAFMIPTGDDPEADNQNENETGQGKTIKNDPPAALKAKYQMGKGSLDGFEEWVADQRSKGRSFNQMEHVLQQAIEKKGA